MKGKFDWHKWFAWRPVVIQNKDKTWSLIWLETLERKRICMHDHFTWDYREIKA